MLLSMIESKSASCHTICCIGPTMLPPSPYFINVVSIAVILAKVNQLICPVDPTFTSEETKVKSLFNIMLFTVKDFKVSEIREPCY